MPRIRSLKPEHKTHRKVGPLSDRQYRLWVGMITEADDEGRLVADAEQLRALIFAYQPRTTAAHIAADLDRLSAVGLIRLYVVNDTTYADLPSWRDHQRVERPSPSKLPPYCYSSNDHRLLTEDSVKTPAGSEGIKDQGEDQGEETPGRAAAAEPASPASPRARIRFDSRQGQIVGIEQPDLERWRALYPAVDLDRETKKAGEWLTNHPERRRSNIAQFLSNWFGREQDAVARRPVVIGRSNDHADGAQQLRRVHDHAAEAAAMIRGRA
jgi:hypothetical protein